MRWSTRWFAWFAWVVVTAVVLGSRRESSIVGGMDGGWNLMYNGWVHMYIHLVCMMDRVGLRAVPSLLLIEVPRIALV